MGQLKGHAGRIVVVRSGAIGDLLACEPALRSLRKDNPDAEIAIQTRCVEAMKGCPHANRLIGGNDGLPGERIVLDGAYESRLDQPRQKAICDSAGLEYPGPSRYWLTRDGRASKEHQRSRPGPLVVVCPHAHWDCRRWDAPRWRDLAGRLQLAGCRVLEVTEPRLVVGAGEACCMPWWRAMGVIAAADCWVGVDSGPMWAALGLGVPTVALFGPTTPGLVSDHPNLIPITAGDEADGCHHKGPFPKDRCVCGISRHAGMMAIPAARVAAEVLGAIERRRASA